MEMILEVDPEFDKTSLTEDSLSYDCNMIFMLSIGLHAFLKLLYHGNLLVLLMGIGI